MNQSELTIFLQQKYSEVSQTLLNISEVQGECMRLILFGMKKNDKYKTSKICKFGRFIFLQKIPSK